MFAKSNVPNWSSDFLLEMLQQIPKTAKWEACRFDALWLGELISHGWYVTPCYPWEGFKTFQGGWIRLALASVSECVLRGSLTPRAGSHLHPPHFPTSPKWPWKRSPCRVPFQQEEGLVSTSCRPSQAVWLITHVDVVWSEELGFTQDRVRLVTFVPVYCPRNFGRTLIWDQTDTFYLRFVERCGAVWKSFPTMGRLGCCDSGSSDFQPHSWVSSGGDFYVTVTRKVMNLPGISSRASLEWIHKAGLRGRGEKEKHCSLFVSTQPTSFNKPATYFGIMRPWALFGHLSNKMFSLWSPLSCVRIQDKFYNCTEHGSRERLPWEKGRIPGWGIKERECRRLPFSKQPRRVGSWVAPLLDTLRGSTFQ